MTLFSIMSLKSDPHRETVTCSVYSGVGRVEGRMGAVRQATACLTRACSSGEGASALHSDSG